MIHQLFRLLAIILLLALAACAPKQRIPLPEPLPGPPAASQPIPKAQSPVPSDNQPNPLVYYVAVERLPLYPQPAFGSPIRTLPLNEKVLRSEVQRGFAHVTIERLGLDGWVDNAKLDWRKAQVKPAPDPRPEATTRSAGPPTAAPSIQVNF